MTIPVGHIIRERDVEKYLIKRVTAMGGHVRKLCYIGRRSATDRLVLLPGRHLFVELKAPCSHATPAQVVEHKKLAWAGCEVFVLKSFDDIDALLDAIIP